MTTPDERPPLPSPPPAVGILGCAGEYQAAVFHRGGQRVFIPASRLGVTVTGVEWERRLNETSVARVIVAKRTLDPACCADLGRVEPWCHELAVYRDQELVWQGPVLRTTEEDAQITIDALDVSAWAGRLVNTQPTWYRLQDPGGIAVSILGRNLNDTTLATPETDWPNMLPYISRSRVPASRYTSVIRLRSIWTDYVLTIINSLADKGFEWTTLGRRFVLRPPKREDQDRARARLTPDHLPGGISVIKDGEDAATRVFATSQTDNDPGITVSVAVPKARAICGRLDMLVRENPRVEVETQQQRTQREDAIKKRRDDRITAERNAAEKDINQILEGPDTPAEKKAAEARRKLRDTRIDQYREDYERELAASNAEIQRKVDAEVRQILTGLARQTLSGRWPVPTVIAVQQNARLSSEAPITVEELIPGERIDVAAVGFCRPVAQAMKLTSVRGTWSAAGEEIGISLTPLTPILEED